MRKLIKTKAGLSVKKPEIESYPGFKILHKIRDIPKYTETKAVYDKLNSKTVVQSIVSMSGLASLMGYSYQTLWRWISDTKQLPAPFLSIEDGGRKRPAYDPAEVEIIMRVIGEHLKTSKYYRKDHDNVKKSVFLEIKHLRLERTETTGVKTNGNTKQNQGPRKFAKSRK